jgi:hypothetical protein
MVLACVFGLIWGAIIYNIDRFIVTSTGKGDGTEAITKQEIKSAIPRIIMGMIIALTISKPIEIRMFQTEIQTELTKIKDNEKTKNADRVERRFKERLIAKDYEINTIQSRVDLAETTYLQLVADINCLQTGTGKYTGTPCTRGENCPTHSALYTSKKSAEKNWNRLKNNTSSDLNRLKKEKDKIIQDKNKQLADLDQVIEGFNGLAIRIKLAEKVAGPWISWFITLLFMVIELTPIFFKMMLIKGPYDFMDDNVKELARAEAGIEIIYNYYEDGQGMEAHKVVNHAAELKSKERLLILKAQEELNEQIINKWKENKKKDIDQNPDKYVQES